MLAILAFWFLFWQFVKSYSFGEYVSGKVKHAIQKDLDIEVEFDNFDINFLPPGVLVKNLTISKNMTDKSNIDQVRVIFNDAGLYFNMVDLFSSKLSIRSIELSEGVINLSLTEKSEEQKTPKTFEELKIEIEDALAYIPRFDEISKKIREDSPVILKGFKLKNTLLKINNNRVYINHIDANLYRKFIAIHFDFQNLNTDQEDNVFYKISELAGTIEYENEKLRLKNLKSRIGINKLEANFFLTENLKKIDLINIDGDVKLEGDLTLFNKIKFINDEMPVFDGLIRVGGKFNGKILDPNFNLIISTHNLHFKYNYHEMGTFKFSKISDDIFIDEAEINHKKSKMLLAERVKLFSAGKFQFGSAKVSVSNLNTNQFLHFSRSLDILKADLSGDVSINWNNKYIEFKSLKKIDIDNFQLLTTNDEVVIGKDYLELPSVYARINYSPFLLEINTHMLFDNSEVFVKGELDTESINFSTKNSFISFKDIGPIFGVDIYGTGPLDIKAYGPMDNAILNLSGYASDISMIDCNFGNGNIDLDFYLNDLKLKILKWNTTFNQSSYDGNGIIDFNSDSPLNLNFNIHKVTIEDFYQILKPVMNKFLDYKKSVNGELFGVAKLTGGFKRESLNMEANISGKQTIIYGEIFKDVNSKLTFKNDIFHVVASEFELDNGKIDFNGEFNLRTEVNKYNFNIVKIQLEELENWKRAGLYLDGILDGDIIGTHTFKGHDLKGKLKLTDSNVVKEAIPSSEAIFSFSDKKLSFSLNLLENEYILAGDLDWSDQSTKSSFISSKINIDDPKRWLSILTGFKIENINIEGVVDATLDAKFNLNNLNDLDLKMNINDFSFYSGDLSLELSDDRNSILIENGEVRKWDVLLTGELNRIISTARGSLSSNVDGLFDFEINSKFLEVVIPDVLRSKGTLKNDTVFSFNSKTYNYKSHLRGEDLAISFRSIPVTFDETNFDFEIKNERLEINNFSGKSGQGNFNIAGEIIFNGLYPTLNLGLDFENISFPYYKKSKIGLNGNLFLNGTELPYLLSGDIVLNQVKILDELKDIKTKKTSDPTIERFLPSSIISYERYFTKLDLKINLANNLLVKNSLFEMDLDGQLIARGDLSKPDISGMVTVPQNGGKIFIKSNEFIVNRGTVLFDGVGRGMDPQINFNANSSINSYLVNLSIYGRASNFTADLSSDPSLPKEDILSLIALGFTGDKSKDLSEDEISSISSVGIGAMIFDQFKINRELDSLLGLKLSISPDFIESNQSYLSGRSSGETSSSTNRVKSATKIKIEKDVGEKFNLSFSNTLGNTSDTQKQEMNLNYKLNEKISVLGVYELETNEAEENPNQPASIGADVLFKWNF